MSFHAFGVVSNPDDFNSVVFDSSIAAATNPLKPGESGRYTPLLLVHLELTTTFVQFLDMHYKEWLVIS